MNDNILLPSKKMIYKNVKENNLKSKLNWLLKHPFGQFMLLGIILIIVNFLSQLGILPRTYGRSIINVIVYSIISLGFCILLGYSGLASLGTAGFAGIGAYFTYLMLQVAGLSFFSAFVVSIAVAIFIGLFVGFISLRIEGMYLAIVTLGLAEIVAEIIQNQGQLVVKLANITFMFIKLNNITKFILFTVLLVLLLLLTDNIIKSPTGRAMLAIKNSPSAAQAMGISLIKYRLLAFVISTVYAAIGGLVYIMNNWVLAADFISLTMSLNILGAVIIGGTKSLWGILFGVLFIFGLNELLFSNIPFFVENPFLINIVTGALTIAVVMFYPGGAYQLFFELKGKINKLILKRRIKKYGTH